MDHGKIVSNAWNITWNHKWLWGLGFLAALASGGSGGSGGNFNMDGMNIDPESADLPLPPFMENLINDPAALMQLAGIAVVAVCLLVIIGIILWFVGQAARAGLITSVNGLEEGRKSSFGEALRGGWQYIWRILGMKIVLWFGFALIIGLLGGAIGAFAIGASSGNDAAVAGIGILACGLICGIFLVIIPLVYTDAYAFRGLVLKEMGIVESIKHGWQLFRANMGDSLILGVIYGVISFAVGVVILAVLAPFAFLAANPVIDLFTTGTISTGAVMGLALGGLTFTIVAALLSSVLTAFQSVGFTLAYREMTGMAAKVDFEKTPEDIDDGDFI